jgi:hypothetical protein
VEHIGAASNWKLKQADQGFDTRVAAVQRSNFLLGWPAYFFRFGRLDIDAKLENLVTLEDDWQLSLRLDATHVENISPYAGRAKAVSRADLVHDGTLASVLTIFVSPTSRVSTALKSAWVEDASALNVNFLDTEDDRLVLHEGYIKPQVHMARPR